MTQTISFFFAFATAHYIFLPTDIILDTVEKKKNNNSGFPVYNYVTLSAKTNLDTPLHFTCKYIIGIGQRALTHLLRIYPTDTREALDDNRSPKKSRRYPPISHTCTRTRTHLSLKTSFSFSLARSTSIYPSLSSRSRRKETAARGPVARRDITSLSPSSIHTHTRITAACSRPCERKRVKKKKGHHPRRTHRAQSASERTLVSERLTSCATAAPLSSDGGGGGGGDRRSAAAAFPPTRESGATQRATLSHTRAHTAAADTAAAGYSAAAAAPRDAHCCCISST